MRRAFFILAFLLPTAVFAQPGRFEITPFTGYRMSGDFNEGPSDALDLRVPLEVEESAVYGVLLDIPLSPNWQLELLANRQKTSFIADRDLLERRDELGDVDITMVHAGILLQWGAGQVNPFLTVSGGLTRIDPQFDDLDPDNRVSASFGGGAKVFFSENVGLRLEARGFWTDLSSGSRNRYDRYDSGDGLSQGEASAGLIIAF